MDLDAETVKQLLDSLKAYNSVANEFANASAKAVIPVAMVILGILWYMDFTSVKSKFTNGDSGIGIEFLIQSSMKYVIAIMLITFSRQMVDAFVYLNSIIGHLINDVTISEKGVGVLGVSVPSISDKGLKWYQKPFINGIQGITFISTWLNIILVKILIFLRFLMLYVSKAAVPLMVAAWVSEDFKPVALGFIKQFIALTIQSLVLLLILKLWPLIAQNDIFNIASSTHWTQSIENLAILVGVLLKSVAFIMTLIGSQALARRWMGV
jgi:hypothetical protein